MEDSNSQAQNATVSLESLAQLLGEEERAVEELLGPPDRLQVSKQKGTSARSYLARGIMVDCSAGKVDSVSLLSEGALNDEEDWREFRGEILSGLSLGMSAEAIEETMGPPHMKHKDLASAWKRERFNITASYDSGRVIAFVISAPSDDRGTQNSGSQKLELRAVTSPTQKETIQLPSEWKEIVVDENTIWVVNHKTTGELLTVDRWSKAQCVEWSVGLSKNESFPAEVTPLEALTIMTFAAQERLEGANPALLTEHAQIPDVNGMKVLRSEVEFSISGKRYRALKYALEGKSDNNFVLVVGGPPDTFESKRTLYETVATSFREVAPEPGP